ncbi:Gfo/Idh/MocA family oxidoreductase [Arenibacter sp. BSSL-BM3]|uniref:Gfo/Idh/MocA family oxidoreductase n=1 Tax=Arenibacter arenosicollis TaxID=2762274 RepID=A0ABR7QHT0_9FLAO|nr:Gfo/Idh/MocA family oxidoreductase [Arenibacter arenosicollis]MBC8766609.1 Gfo/Idh/MocA family oxidoreductase [Arenibacter arenosicollis]
MKNAFSLSFCVILLTLTSTFAQKKPIKLGVVGLTHGHVGWILSREAKDDIIMVGIVETNRDLAQRLSNKHGFPMEMVFNSMEEMIAAVKPEAVAGFGNIYDHLAIVEICAPKGIHVMVEKPLAVSLEHAQKMEALAKKHKIHLLTNYETSWYPTNLKAYELLQEGTIGDLRKVIVRDGHKGPKKIGVSAEFLNFLTDPILNGGGAIMDFGCYGANLMTWLQQGKRPNSVTAVTQQLQPENNPKVDDDATIILTYDSAMAILEPSWNWPIGRKDMEIYGLKGAIYADNRHDMRVRISEGYSGFKEEAFKLGERDAPYDEPFSLFASVIRGETTLGSYDPYSLENNMITMEILEAAVQSSKSQRTIQLKN